MKIQLSYKWIGIVFMSSAILALIGLGLLIAGIWWGVVLLCIGIIIRIIIIGYRGERNVKL
jgi:hypothetical protein